MQQCLRSFSEKRAHRTVFIFSLLTSGDSKLTYGSKKKRAFLLTTVLVVLRLTAFLHVPHYTVNFKHRVASCMTWHSIEQNSATRQRTQRYDAGSMHTEHKWC